MEVTNSLTSGSNNVYPICYKIKETSYQANCPPSCINKLAKYVKLKKKIYGKNPNATEEAHQSFVQCLKQYGDIYKKLGIELYVNPTTNKITFPDNQRIQSNLNEYMRKIADNDANNIDMSSDETLMLYNVLLNDSLRNAYNDFYVSEGYAKNVHPLATIDEIPTPMSMPSPSSSKSSNPFSSKTSKPFSRKMSAQQKHFENDNDSIKTPNSSMGGKMKRTRKHRKSRKRRKTCKRGKNKRKKIINK